MNKDKAEKIEAFKDIEGVDATDAYNHVYHELYDKTRVPYGSYKEDGIYHLYFKTTSRYGYSIDPIYGVSINHESTEKQQGYIDYRIFVGECPHKDENGNWVTYGNVPNFILNSFPGAHFIDKEADVPHIIRLITDEFDKQCKDVNKVDANKQQHDICDLNQKIQYCTFKTYIKGLYHRLTKHTGEFFHHKGKRINQFGYRFPSYPNIVFQWNKNDKRFYLWIETDKWNRTLDFIKNGKIFIKWNKWENEHCYSEC